MSIVVAVQKDREIVIATDSQTNSGSMIDAAPNTLVRKVSKIGSSYIASTGWSVYDMLIEDYCKGIKSLSLDNEGQIFKFFIGFWKAMQDKYHFVNNQCDGNDESPFADLDNNFLVCNRKGIFQVDSDLTVMKFEQFRAIGSGREFATGALHVLYEQKNQSAEKLATCAVEAAIKYNMYCGGDVQSVRLKAS